ncbi:Blp family class II bacteriocin [Lacticaseibacillus paracasei]|uniref:Bacteriocin class II with double-glycine leader peptide n=5 Tax=Lacticaseibacillus paracasei TaxID=1597 RepID=A0A806LE64_LACPA|nr:Blp family class II bacteriocin [Lacticaseibacillus paracasei]EPC48633.1 hypothetical protein Lpp7_14650 [Lacticaseibacillus paracasei subsp. paracasei Lpp7]EPC72085.1 hypothetical protein Lpp71_11690 [Lacticaseibacillus paracasei subsp. paracasei Lpp71]MBS5747532.1 Blp family class II bacteriocin [Streptococcus sp.]PTS55625.1 hypothetical protein DBQ61_12210 [Lactobacillus sp. DS22_6]AHJ34261.1 hypothetical protein AF91_14325 [Lacticaseibacillus paracasei N1115]
MSKTRKLSELELQQFVGGSDSNKCLMGLVGGGAIGGLNGAGSLSGFGPAGVTIGGLYGTLSGILTGYATSC